LIPFFPILGFTDLIGRNNHFLLLTSYFAGSNVFGIFVIKVAEYFWIEKTPQPERHSVTFIYLTSMPRTVWSRFHAFELITCLSILFYFFYLKRKFRELQFLIFSSAIYWHRNGRLGTLFPYWSIQHSSHLLGTDQRWILLIRSGN
jgi:hypothetical protein